MSVRNLIYLCNFESTMIGYVLAKCDVSVDNNAGYVKSERNQVTLKLEHKINYDSL